MTPLPVMAHSPIDIGDRIAEPFPTPAVASNPFAQSGPQRLAYSYGESARAVGCSARTIWSACASGELRAARIGRRRVIGVDELRRWLDAKAGIVAVAKGVADAC